MTPRPDESWRDAFDAHLEQSKWTESATGQAYLKNMFEDISSEYTDPGTIRLLAGAYQSEAIRLRDAAPFFVSREMCEVVAHASESFKPEPLWPPDLLQLQGFIYYEKPFTIRDRFDRPVKIKAVSWQPAMADEGFTHDRLLSRDDEMREWLEERHEQGLVDGLILSIYEETDKDEWPAHLPAPPLLVMHMTPWWWGMSFEGNEMTADGRPTAAEWWWKIVQTTFRLMQQQITVRREERPFRARRREARRLNMPDFPMLVVTLRREYEPGHHDPSGAEASYSHRFMVGGHWRNQWYPSSRMHRQIYIAPFIKGPEDAPLIIKPRAYTWTR